MVQLGVLRVVDNSVATLAGPTIDKPLKFKHLVTGVRRWRSTIQPGRIILPAYPPPPGMEGFAHESETALVPASEQPAGVFRDGAHLKRTCSRSDCGSEENDRDGAHHTVGGCASGGYDKNQETRHI